MRVLCYALHAGCKLGDLSGPRARNFPFAVAVEGCVHPGIVPLFVQVEPDKKRCHLAHCPRETRHERQPAVWEVAGTSRSVGFAKSSS